jgi:hypothetical protein
MLRFFSNFLLLYPKMAALVAQQCGVPGAQFAVAMFAPPEPRPLALVNALELPEVAKRNVLPPARRHITRRKPRRAASMKRKARRKAA